MKEAFQVFACLKNGILYSDIPVNSEILNTIQIGENQMLLMGRALTNFSSDDKLYNISGDFVTPLYFYIYGHKMDFISIGCTCIILCTPIINISFSSDNLLYLY